MFKYNHCKIQFMNLKTYLDFWINILFVVCFTSLIDYIEGSKTRQVIQSETNFIFIIVWYLYSFVTWFLSCRFQQNLSISWRETGCETCHPGRRGLWWRPPPSGFYGPIGVEGRCDHHRNVPPTRVGPGMVAHRFEGVV